MQSARSESRLSTAALSTTAAGLAFALLCSLPAAALTIDDITPLYFTGTGGQGFDPDDVAASGLAPSLAATSSDLFLGAGGPSTGAPVQVTSQVVTTIHQLPSNPTPQNPAIVDSTWTIENVGAGALVAPALLFTTLDPLDTYPGDPQIGLDANLLDLLAYTPPVGAGLVYGTVILPDLAQGEATEVLVRYVVAGPLQINDVSQVLAPLGLAVAVTYTELPEPTTLWLCVVGLVGSAASGRRRRTARGGRSMENAACPDPRDAAAR